jgi:hypothetical protein
MRPKLKLFLALASSLALVAASSCAYDFDQFEPGAGPAADGGADTFVPTDAGKDTSVADTGTPPIDTGTVDTAVPPVDTGCTPSPTCLSTATSCAASCTSTANTCISNCGGSGSCKAKCNNTLANCKSTCTNDCTSCTQSAGCRSFSACQAAAI